MTRKETARAVFTGVEEELKSVSRWMYEIPEVAYEEYGHTSLRRSVQTGDTGFEGSQG